MGDTCSAPSVARVRNGCSIPEKDVLVPMSEVISMKIRSNDFQHNELIPALFTCDGRDLSPHLQWSSFPEETKSFALSAFDPDAPGTGWTHWLIQDIPKGTTSLERGANISATEVMNSFGKTAYGGPCPPSGTHRYFFTIYALDVEHLENITEHNFNGIIKEHTLASAELVGLYKRKQP